MNRIGWVNAGFVYVAKRAGLGGVGGRVSMCQEGGRASFVYCFCFFYIFEGVALCEVFLGF